MPHKNIVLHVSLIHGVGTVCIQKIVQAVGLSNLAQVYTFSLADFIAMGIAQAQAQAVVAGLQDRSLLHKELELIAQHEVTILTLWCDAYPMHLRHIHVPPAVLYVQGNSKLLLQEKMLACVGSRLAGNYVQRCLDHLVVPLINDGWTIVSGGALGADTFAHKVALAHAGKTVVVVGSGLCYQYPDKNKTLFSQVVQSGGLIVSCFSMQTKPEAHCFPIRNRIISGLSLGCLVLQAAHKSGALITAQCALDQGREVFAVPGLLDDPLSVGCHELIQQGAKLVTNSQDILEELQGYGSNQVIQSEQTMVVPATLDPLSLAILQATTTAKSLDDLLLTLQIVPAQLHQALFTLSLDGKIEQDVLGLWKTK